MAMSAVASESLTEKKSGFDFIAFGAILVTILFWASSFAVIRVCLGPLTPIELAAARYVSAGLLGAIYLLIVRPMWQIRGTPLRPPAHRSGCTGEGWALSS